MIFTEFYEKKVFSFRLVQEAKGVYLSVLVSSQVNHNIIHGWSGDKLIKCSRNLKFKDQVFSFNFSVLKRLVIFSRMM